MRTLFAIISHEANFSLRQAIRETWLPLVHPSADVFFFIGGTRFVKGCDIVALATPDHYEVLPLKVQAMFRWALANGYDRIWKLDDDVYAVPELLLRVPPGLDYVGRFREPSDGKPAPYASGFAYMLSRNAATIVANKEVPVGEWAEDRFTGNALYKSGLQSRQVGNWLFAVPPSLKPEAIVRMSARFAAAFCEFKRTDQMYDMHAQHNTYVRPHLDQTTFPATERVEN